MLSVGQLWNGFIAALVLFFILTIVDQARPLRGRVSLSPATRPLLARHPQLAKSKQAELDEVELHALEEELRSSYKKTK